MVRARIVLKDIAAGQASARTIGISSPTPSSEALFLMLGIAGTRNFIIGAGDVVSAFMATPLRKRTAVAKMPLSVSSLKGEPMFLHLSKALNGLRSASQEWSVYLASIVATVGLEACDLEPCLYSGKLPTGEVCLLMSYVDDLLVCAPSEDAVDMVFSALEKQVTLKRTGLVGDSKTGGQIRFLGRLITRRKGETSVLVSLPTDYLDSTFATYNIKNSSSSPPDITPVLEGTGTGNEAQSRLAPTELTEEGYIRFRSALGKVAWLTQTRQDLRAWVGYLATQQARPTNKTEHALRMILRYLKQDMEVCIRLPSESDGLICPEREVPVSGPLPRAGWDMAPDSGPLPMICYSDASHAPMKSTGRRGVTGGVLSWGGCLLKTLSRHQGLVSLSSMEAELYALQATAQEMVPLGKLIARVLRSFKEYDGNEISGILYTDSESAIKLIKGMDIPRKSRHLEIRLSWIKERIQLKQLILNYCRGTENPSDMLTKCLGSSLFGIHRENLGFEVIAGPLLGLLTAVSKRQLVFVEVCCQEDSAISRSANDLGFHYIGVTQNMEQTAVYQQVRDTLLELGLCKVFVHLSSPCTSGSPLRHLRSLSNREPTQAEIQWFDIFPKVGKYLRLGDETSFELPWRNDIWKYDLTRRTLAQANHHYFTGVRLCATGMKNQKGMSIGKVFGFSTSSKIFKDRLSQAFGTCTCAASQHAGLTDVSWPSTAYYNDALAKEILKSAKEALINK